MIKNMITVENAIDQLKHYLSEVELKAKSPKQKRALYNNIEALNVIIDWYNSTQEQSNKKARCSTTESDNYSQAANLLQVPCALYSEIMFIKDEEPDFYHYYYFKYSQQLNFTGQFSVLRLFSEIKRQYDIVNSLRKDLSSLNNYYDFCKQHEELHTLIPQYENEINKASETLRMLCDYSDMDIFEKRLSY